MWHSILETDVLVSKHRSPHTSFMTVNKLPTISEPQLPHLPKYSVVRRITWNIVCKAYGRKSDSWWCSSDISSLVLLFIKTNLKWEDLWLGNVSHPHTLTCEHYPVLKAPVCGFGYSSFIGIHLSPHMTVTQEKYYCDKINYLIKCCLH